jgi:hypothetical protein
LRSYERRPTASAGSYRCLSAIVRVGRTITIIETITQDSAGNVVMPLDQFRTIVANIVNRARAALGA